ncbi:cellulose synthase subunit [Mucilaginibacter lappiensis]|uniref:Papain-like cysteine protease AvrRpt2 n=1 Tax=Mucilaginibacter lappiensis TaxID=354630 RepID=A0ABR6PIR6_9SPHI|nr:papain-like cysteine protease family protein [Mucilaginibacter lappiensis]MBB6109109.1 hypothetical protein [Mucilaginibacter lappiensis]SIQ75970.1 cellulose synthase subunit [Mucilaginibacter lappiensis]
MQASILFSVEKNFTDHIRDLSLGPQQTDEKLPEGYRFNSPESFIRFTFRPAVKKTMYLLLRYQAIAKKNGRNGALNILLNQQWLGQMEISHDGNNNLNMLAIDPNKLQSGSNELLIRMAGNHWIVSIQELWISDYMIDRQLQSNWCWAAVTASLARFYQKDHFGDQAKLVSGIFNKEYCCNGKGCGTCNRPWYVGEALDHAGILQRAIPNPVSQEALMTELTCNRPVVVVIKWRQSATGHILVVSGFTHSRQFLTWDSRGQRMRLLSFNDLSKGYEGKSVWVNTFFTGLS